MANQLESFVARGRHPRNVKDEREISFGLADLSTNNDLHERLVRKGGIETLANLLGTCQDSESQQFAALAIANTASTYSLCREIAKLDGVLESLVAYVGNDHGDPIGRQYGAMALGNLLADPENHESIVEFRCIPSLITMLQNCSDGRELEAGTYAAFAISNIATDCSYHQRIVEEGAIELLIALACCDDEEARRHALLSLRGLCGTKCNSQKMLQKGILDPLILLSRSHDKDIVKEVSCILNCLSSDDENKEEISYRAMSTLISLLMSGDDYVERHSCCAIANLLEMLDIHSRFIEERGLPPLVSSCSCFDGDCREEAMRAVANLSYNREMVEALVEENSLHPLVKAVDIDQSRFAALTIANIATDSSTIFQVVQEGAIRPLVSLISMSDNDVESGRFAALALANITTCEAFHSIVIEAGAPEALFALSNSSDAESKQYVAKTLANLSGNVANHERIVEKGGFQTIIALANDPIPDIHRYAVAAMWGLSAASSKLRTNLVDEGGLGPLCRLFPSSLNDQQLSHDITACLCNLSHENENKFEIARSGAVSTLLSCMGCDNSTIAYYACECLANLSEMVENQGFLARSGVITPCASVMRSRQNLSQRESGRLSANISGSTDQLAANVIVDDGVHSLLMSFLLSKDLACQKIGSIGIGNLCSNDCHRELLMHCGVLEPLISLTRSEKSEIEARRFSMLAIANLAASFANHNEFVSQGAIPMLVSFTNSDDIYLKDYAAFALAELSRNANMTAMLADEGALDPVLALFNSKGCHISVQRQMLPSIRTLSFLNTNKVAICASGSLGVILGFISDCNGTVDELQLACCTIANLIELECNMELAVYSGCIPILICALKSDFERVQSESARALGNLAANIDLCDLLLDHGVAQLLVACYRGNSIESRRMAAMALTNLSSNTKAHPELLELNVLGLATSECLAALDLKQSSDHETLRFCILLIANLTGGNQSLSLTENLSDVDDRSEDILMNFTRHRDIKCREHAVLALGNLCTNPVHVKRLVDIKCVDALIAYSFPTTAEDSVNAQFQAIAGLHGLSKHSELRAPLLREGGLEPIILGLRGGIEIQRESAAALSNMAMAKENRILIAKSGALPTLKELLKSEDCICRNRASSALANLAESSSEGIHELLLDDCCLNIMCKRVNDKDSHVDTKRAISRCLALFAGNSQVHEYLLSGDVLNSLNVLIAVTDDRYCARCGILAVANLVQVTSNHHVVLSTITFQTILSLSLSDDVKTLRSLSFALHSFSKRERNHAILEEANAADSLVTLLRCDDYDTSFHACMATKYLCTSENWRNIIVESNGLGAVLSLASSYDLELKREVAATLRNMSLGDGSKRRIMVEDGMEIIAKLCRDSDSTVSHQACGTLANIAERQENKVDMVKQGLIHHLQFAMLTKYTPILRESMRAFANLSSAGENAAVILASSAFILIIDSLRCDDILCSRYAAMILSNLSIVTEDCRQKIVQEGGISPLVSLIEKQSTDIPTQQHAMTCLANLASSRSLQNSLILCGCTEVACDRIKSVDLDLRASALLFVANLASNVKSHVALDDACITKDLINCLECKSRLVQMHAMDALRGLSTSASIRDKIISCGGLESLLAFVNSNDTELKQEVLFTLCNLSMSGTISDQTTTILQNVDLQLLIGFLCNETSKSYRVFGAMAIGNIACNLDFHNHILESGALENLIGLSVSNDDDIESQRCMAFAICNLAVQPTNRPFIVSSGALSSIMYLCHTTDPRDTLFGLSTLRVLTSTDDSRRAIFEEGVLHILLLALKTGCLDCKREIASMLALLSLNDENKFDLAHSDEIKEFMCLLKVDDAHCISLICRCIGSICEVNELHPQILNCFPLEQLPRLTSDTDPKVVKEVVRCCANLSRNWDSRTVIVTPAMIKNLSILCSHYDSDVRRLSSLTFSNIFAGEVNVTLNSNDVLCALHSIIDDNKLIGSSSHNLESKCYAFLALGSLVSEDHLAATQIVSMGIIPLLLQLLSVEDEQLNLCTVYLIGKLSVNEDTHPDIHANRTISHLINHKYATGHVRTYSIGAIRKLCENRSTDIECLMVNEIIQFVVESCAYDNMECCRQIVSCICHLALRNEARTEIVMSKMMMDSLFDLCKLTDVEVCRFALGSIANIAEDYRLCRAITPPADTVASLVCLIDCDNTSIVREASRVIANLLSSTEFQAEFLKERGLVSIIRISRSHDYECVRNVALAIRKLAANKASHGILFSQHGVEAIMHLADHEELQVRIQSAAALRDISSNADFQLAIKDCGVVEIAIELTCQSEIELKILAMGIFRHLSVAMNLKRELMDRAIINVLSECVMSSDCEALLFECASFIANLAEHAQNKYSLVQSGILQLLVMLSKHDSVQVKRNSARAFALLSSTPRNYDEFVGSVLEVLIDLLQCQDEETCRNISVAIVNIATNNEISCIIGNLGAIHPLVLLLKSPSCQKNSCHALSRLTTVEENKASVILYHGIDPLIQLCASEHDNVSVLATMVLCNLSTCSSHEHEFIRGDLIQVLSRVASCKCPASCNYAIMALCNLTSMCRVRDLVARDVCLMQLFDLMKGATLDCRVYTTMLICNLSSVEKHKAAILTAGGLFCLESFAASAGDISLQRASLLALYNLSACDETLATIRQSGLIQFIVTACQSHDLLCQRCALMILSNIASSDESRAVATRGGGLQAAIISLKGNDAPSQRFGLVCLTNMSNDTHIQSQIVVHGGLHSIINLLREGDRETRECALLCLSNLCANEAIHSSLVDQQISKVLADACKDNQSITAVFALANLTSSDELLHDIGAGEGILTLIDLAKSSDAHDQCLAISALRRLASVAKNRDVQFYQSILLSLVNTNMKHQDVRREIASCLCALSLSSRHRFSMARIATSLLMEFVQSTDSATARFGLGAIATVAEDGSTHPILINANVMEDIIQRLSHAETVIKQEATRAISNLLSSKELHTTFIRHGLRSLVQLQTAACEDCNCLAALSFSKLSVTMGFVSDEVLKYLLTLFKSKDEMTRKHALIALRNLSASSKDKGAFFKLNIPALMAGVLSDKEKDLDVLAAATLRSLSCCSSCITDKCLEDGILHSVIRSIPNANVELKSQIAAIVANLSEHLACQPIMISHAVVKAICILSTVDHGDVMKECARALANLCSVEKALHAIYRQGGFKTLDTLRHSDCETCKRYVAIALRFMASSVEVQRSLFADDAFSLYLNMSTSDSLDYQRSAAASFSSMSQTEEGRLMIKKDGISAILRLCSHADLHVRRHAVFAVANLSASPEMRQYIAIEGGVEAIRSASTTNSDVDFLRDAARAMSTLAVDTSIKDAMVSQEIPRALSKLAKSADSETQRFASLALCNLCVGTQQQKEYIAKQGVLRVLSFLLRYPDLEVERRASLAIAALSLGSDRNTLQIVGGGFIRSLLEATSYPDPKLRHCALLALSSIVSSTEPTTKHRVVEENGLSSLLSTLKSFKDDESDHACIYLLGSLAEDAEIIKAIVDMNSFLPLVVHKLESAGSIETKRSAGYFLALLSEYQECHERLQEANALESVVALISLVDEECQYYGAFALALLAKNNSFQVPLTKMGGVRPLVSILAKRSDARHWSSARHWAALALLKLADNFNNHITIAEEGGIQALLQLGGADGAGVTVANLAKRAFDDAMNNRKRW